MLYALCLLSFAICRRSVVACLLSSAAWRLSSITFLLSTLLGLNHVCMLRQKRTNLSKKFSLLFTVHL